MKLQYKEWQKSRKRVQDARVKLGELMEPREKLIKVAPSPHSNVYSEAFEKWLDS